MSSEMVSLHLPEYHLREFFLNCILITEVFFFKNKINLKYFH